MAKDVQPASQLQAFREQLELQTKNLAMVLPDKTLAKFKHIVLTTLSDNPDLLRCDPRTILSVCRRAAQDGLMLDGKEAAIVPFKDGNNVIASYIPMIFGIRKKVRGSGLLAEWSVNVVFEGDEFDIALGDHPYVHHKPSLTGGQKRPVVACYSIATFPDGTKSYDFMNIDQINDIRSLSKAKSGPWSNQIFFPEMCRKTMARRHAKQLPQSSDVQVFFRRMDEDEGALPPPSSAPPLPPPTARPKSVGHTLDEFGAGTEPSSPDRDTGAPSTPTHPETDDQGADTRQPSTSGSASARAPDGGVDATEALASGAMLTMTGGGGGGGSTAMGDAMTAAKLDAVKRAYRRGQDDRRRNVKADDMPEEFRTNDRNREQIAWTCGY